MSEKAWTNYAQITFKEAERLWKYIHEELDFVIGGTISAYWTVGGEAPICEIGTGIMEMDEPIILVIDGRQLEILTDMEGVYHVSVDAIDLSKPVKYLESYYPWEKNAHPALNGIIGQSITRIYVRTDTGYHFMNDALTIIYSIRFILQGYKMLEISADYDWMLVEYDAGSEKCD